MQGSKSTFFDFGGPILRVLTSDLAALSISTRTPPACGGAESIRLTRKSASGHREPKKLTDTTISKSTLFSIEHLIFPNTSDTGLRNNSHSSIGQKMAGPNQAEGDDSNRNAKRSKRRPLLCFLVIIRTNERHTFWR